MTFHKTFGYGCIVLICFELLFAGVETSSENDDEYLTQKGIVYPFTLLKLHLRIEIFIHLTRRVKGYTRFV